MVESSSPHGLDRELKLQQATVRMVTQLGRPVRTGRVLRGVDAMQMYLKRVHNKFA